MKEVVLFIHIVLACLWVGGMLFLVFVFAPYIRRLPFRDQAFQEVGKRFSFYGTLLALSLLFITGMLNFHHVVGISNLFEFQSVYVKTFWQKLGFFILVVIVSLVHDLYFGKRSVGSDFHRFMARLLGFLNLFLSLFIIYLAVKLRFGG
ncbi:MAG: hypothetical protein D6699_03670 [Aquificota bacterium]|jgi:putative copper export protein|nr:MAG: hypothetical protein D6699_03670 [Aquificota bacterium]